MLCRKPGPYHQWARGVARVYSKQLCSANADSKFMLPRSSEYLPQSSASLKSSLWTSSRSSQTRGDPWRITRPNFLGSRGFPFSTSKQPGGSQRPTKPLLKVFSKITTPHENIYTVPNILTFSRLIAAPVVGYLVLHDHHAWAVGLFAYAGITDLVDGWIARKWNLQTVVGTVIDPMADKTLMTILTVCLAIKSALPVWLAAIILGRDVGLAITAIYYRWISLPPPKTFARYWDFSLPSAEVRPTTISKYNTALQLAFIGATTAMPLLTVDVTAAMTAMQYLVATTTVWSGASYIYSKDAVKILNQDKGSNSKETEDKI
ncbi:related to cardiolipin synthase [Rhynchosporium agropyri]|uniref:Related to cardiolipin synthase n=1 Tax=Rhynchosporium agropyri TaxID=914238 RepID=A0A1E1K4P7_9HELO|nr:related to cardiolipin synthase [Rhynchosporium agropyri]